jgi:Ca-activated chloride channel family protein
VAEAGPYANNYYTNPSAGASPTPSPTPVPAGTHAPASIVLLSDGENNESPDPIAAAQTAADQGVRIYTIGIGSAAGTTVTVSGFQEHTQLDQATLESIAQTTGGTYYAATDTAQLHTVYDNLDTAVVIQPQMTEITSIFAGVSLALLIGGAMTSLLWLGRLP